MPETSSPSFVRTWPKPDQVLAELREWAEGQAAIRPGLITLGYFGSHARGEAGFGSDLDLVAIVKGDDAPQMQRNRDWPYEQLPVPTDLLVYTIEEWRRMKQRGGRFGKMMGEEVVWVLGDGRNDIVRP